MILPSFLCGLTSGCACFQLSFQLSSLTLLAIACGRCASSGDTDCKGPGNRGRVRSERQADSSHSSHGGSPQKGIPNKVDPQEGHAVDDEGAEGAYSPTKSVSPIEEQLLEPPLIRLCTGCNSVGWIVFRVRNSLCNIHEGETKDIADDFTDSITRS